MVAENDDVRDIAIYDGAAEQERRRCRVVGLPDGREGVFWRGLIYPLKGDSTVDISGEAFLPSSTSSAPAKSAKSSGTPSCALVDGDQESWLLVAGSAADQAAMAVRLRGAGIEIVRAGRYLGEPAGGVSADWYIRIIKPADPTALHQILSQSLADPGSLPSLDQSPAQLRVRLLIAELAMSRTRVANLLSELARVRADAAAREGRADENTALKEAIDDEQRLRLEAEVAREAAEQALAAVSVREGQPDVPRGRTKLQDELAVVIQSFLPNLRLLRNSLGVAAMEYSDRTFLYRALAELRDADGRLPPAWKALQGVSAWWERHVSNGQDNTGRLYACFVNVERLWVVLISHKSEQPRDVIWLRHLRQ
jgi:hypothetical protein